MPDRNKVKPIRTYTSGVVPDATEIETNELAISWADGGKLFTKDASGNIVSLTLGGSGGGGSANIVEATTAAGFPATGASSTLYISRDSSRVYRYDSSGVYIEIGN